MKKWISVMVAVALTCAIFTGCIRETASGKNAQIDYTGTASVSFYPVCPECDHVSPECSVNISDGEYEEGSYMCEKRYAVYTITIDRR